jgi:hypothetical protein
MRGAWLLGTFALLATAGCGDDAGDGSGTSGGAGGETATGGAGGDPTPAESCTHPGDVGNDKGVGQYCTPTGKQCVDFPEAALCLASVGQDQWFCTRINCDETTDCGEGAGCLITGDGSACVPCHCDDGGIGCPGNTGGGGVGGAGVGGAGGAGGTGGAA